MLKDPICDAEQTIKWLQKAYEDHAVWIAYLAVDPVIEGFRSDPFGLAAAWKYSQVRNG